MKKVLIVVLSLLLAMSLAACGTGGDTPPTSAEPPVAPEEPEAPVEPEAPEPSEEPDMPQESVPNLPMVAGAAMYRGTVKDIEETDDGIKVRVEQEKGVDYGYKSFEILLNQDTNTDFDLSDLEEGMHLEIYYGAPMGGQVEQPVNAIQAGKLADGDLTVFNGIITSITVPEDDGDDDMGVLMMEDMDSGETVQFNYSMATQFYLNTDELAEGDALNIFFSGATTRSIPPQAFALEVRPYTDPDSIA